MRVPGHLTVSSQTLNGLTFPGDIVVFDVVQNTRIENKEAPVDPSFSFFRLLVKITDRPPVDGHPAKARWSADSGYGRQFPMTLVKSHQSVQVDIRDTVTVSEHKSLVLLKPA